MEYQAEELRKDIAKIPKDKNGYYIWWANKTEFLEITDKLSIDFDDIKNELKAKEDYYAIYVGIAVGESVQKRLNWHINSRNIRNSTFRRSISAMFGNDIAVINRFIDKLKVEIYFDCPKEELHNVEKRIMEENFYILNIQDNHHILSEKSKKKLKELRKATRNI